MGCSPSRGNNFGTQGPFRRGRTLLPANQEVSVESQSEEGGNGASIRSGDTDVDVGKRRPSAQTYSSQREVRMSPSTPRKKTSLMTELVPEAVILANLPEKDIEIKVPSRGKEKSGDKQDFAEKRSGRKPKKNSKCVKQSKKKETEKKPPTVEKKVDFPEPLVKAHQAAYGFLNPSIAKYETLLALLEQATQTQVAVQPMIAFIALRYEGINHGLREMAEEGEKLLKENGEHLAWPSQMKNLSSVKATDSGSVTADPPPDLLQQLLQYTTQRMRNVGQSVSGIGDVALEEALEYFASVTELLTEKLKAKHAAEARLMRLLTRIEAASLRKPGPDDSALFSEDSGIGAENESLTGSERRLRSGSCESTSTLRTFPSSSSSGSGTPVKQGAVRQNFPNKISTSVSLHSLDSSTSTILAKDQRDTDSILRSPSLDDGEGDIDDDVNDGKAEEEAVHLEGRGRKKCTSSVPDHDQPPRRLPPKRIENPQNVEMTLKMKDAISGRISFVPSQHTKTKPTESPKARKQQWADGEQRTPKRPQTAAPAKKPVRKTTVTTRERRSRSEESLRGRAEDPTLLELERTQRDLSQRLEKMSRGRVNIKTNPPKQSPGNAAQSSVSTNPPKQKQGNTAQSPALNRRSRSLEKNSSSRLTKDRTGLVNSNPEDQVASKEIEDDKTDMKPSTGPLRATPPPSPPLSRPSSRLYRGRNSVKKLIDTFSQGMEEPKPESTKVLGPLKGVRKCGVPILPGLGNVELALSTGLTSCRAESRNSERNGDLDLDCLPPPPLEVLLDNSFEDAQSLLASDVEDGGLGRGRSTVAKRITASQRLRASMQSVTVLPSRGSMPHSSRSMSPARSVHKPDSSGNTRIILPEVTQQDTEPEIDETVSLYKQARKIIHLQHSSESGTGKPISSESSMGRPHTDSVSEKLSLDHVGSGEIQEGMRQDISSQSETVPPIPASCSQPAATPTRARILPSTPSTPSSLQRRLPSPPTYKSQPTPPSSNSPAVLRKLPSPPPLQRRLPSPPVFRRETTPTSFKAPSPPASPRLQRWIQDNSSEDSGSSGASTTSKTNSNARSVFCPASPSLFEAQPCPMPRPPQAWVTGVSVLPRPWGDRGRLPVSARGPQPFVRRTQSDRRPSLSMPSRGPSVSVAESCGSEPSISTQGLEDEPIREDDRWNSHTDIWGSTRSPSLPDLCIVGQALYRE